MAQPVFKRVGMIQGRNQWFGLCALVLSLSIIYLDKTIVPVALVSIQKDFQINDLALQWCVNAYLLSTAIFVLVAGKLSDQIGHKSALLLGVAAVSIASVLCAISPNISCLIAARAIKGLGAAFILTSQPALIGCIFPPNKVGRAMGLNTSISSLFMIFGPLIGGYLVDFISWRWIFWINLPISVFSTMIALRFIPKTPLAQTREEHPFLDRALFKNPRFIAICVLIGTSQFVLMINVYRAIYFQTVLEYSASEVGLILFFSCAPVLFSSQIAGVLYDKTNPKIPVGLGFMFLIYSFLSMALFPTSPWIIFPIIAFGIGLPLILVPSHSAIFGIIPPNKLGAAFGTLGTLRAFSATLGVAMIAWFENSMQNHYLISFPEKVSKIMSYSAVHFALTSLLVLEFIAIYFFENNLLKNHDLRLSSTPSKVE
jgi:multidrug resistance protein